MKSQLHSFSNTYWRNISLFAPCPSWPASNWHAGETGLATALPRPNFPTAVSQRAAGCDSPLIKAVNVAALGSSSFHWLCLTPPKIIVWPELDSFLQFFLATFPSVLILNGQQLTGRSVASSNLASRVPLERRPNRNWAELLHRNQISHESWVTGCFRTETALHLLPFI